MNWYLKVLRNYIGFSGRASRMEFWMYTLITTIISIIIMILDTTLFDWQPLTDTLYGTMFSWGPLLSIYILLTFLPNLALSFRRLHDTDHSAWWLLISLVPLVGGIVLLVFYCLPGTQGDNRFGPDPKV
ncbi:DUF805 domain-containing protein [Enterobacteriaceae bacterium ESL0689]|nr:DUF805 domain-containing protein [Enterobacteriaceae bacterium ESL0689]